MQGRNLQTEMGRMIKILYEVSPTAKRESRQALLEGARILVRAAKEKAPVGDRIHKMYRYGEVVATYYPRNLRNSIRTLSLRRSQAVFVGPVLAKGEHGGTYKGNRADGYYAHMVEFGTVDQPPQPFMRPTASDFGQRAIEKANRALARKINNWAKRYAIARGRE